jgi:hypothetical protein
MTASELWPDLLGEGFQWNSTLHDSARAAGFSLNFEGKPASECVAWFAGGRLSRISMVFYDRGDGGELSRSQFDALVAGVRDAFTNFTGVQPGDTVRDEKSASHAEITVWPARTGKFTLESSFTKDPAFRAEFVRVIAESPASELAPIGADESSQGSHAISQDFRGEDHVATSMNGDVVIKDVPMVDQGDRGYCVVASAERVLRYYGADVDQNELAQLAGSDAVEGTSPNVMMTSLQNLTMRLKVHVRTILDDNSANFMQIVNDYNQAVRAGSEIRVGSMDDFAKSSRTIDLDLLRKVETRDTAGFGKFQRDIPRYIDKGIPLLWGVMLGLVPDAAFPPGVAGGHMRLIIGYNKQTKELIYSDSAGPGFEKRSMPMADAWAMTMGLYVIEPSL